MGSGGAKKLNEDRKVIFFKSNLYQYLNCRGTQWDASPHQELASPQQDLGVPHRDLSAG